MLSENEIEYYSRQLLVDEIGLSGQEKLKKSKVLVVGAGGLGCPVLQYLAAAGVGEIGIIDADDVDVSNLHRQILFNKESLGHNKANEAKRKLHLLNPFISINAYPYWITSDNALSIIGNYHYVVDCTDNYETRFLVNDACVLLNKPLIFGSIYRFEGQVSVFNYKNGPTYRCLFPEKPTEESTTNCSISGVIGILPGIIGVFQASEVIKIITGIGEVLSGKILLFNALNNTTDFFELKRNTQIDYSNIHSNGSLRKNFYSASCSSDNQLAIREISTKELLENSSAANFVFLDVREYGETPIFEHEKVIQIPLKYLKEQLDKIPRNSEIIVFCKSGMRSRKAIELLQNEFEFDKLLNLSNGISTQFIQSWQTTKNQ